MPARVAPAFLTRQRVQCRRLPFADLALASPQNDGPILERGLRGGKLAGAAAECAQVPAGGLKVQLASPVEGLRGSRRIEPAKVFTRPRESNMHQAGFVARPAGSSIAEGRLQIGKVRASVGAAILAGLPPKRQPLARMAVADCLRRAQGR